MAKVNIENVLVDNEIEWIYKKPDNPYVKMLLLTIGNIGIVGVWGDSELGKEFKGYYPMPKRNKEKEQLLNIF